jgi:hypothetical protein
VGPDAYNGYKRIVFTLKGKAFPEGREGFFENVSLTGVAGLILVFVEKEIVFTGIVGPNVFDTFE